MGAGEGVQIMLTGVSRVREGGAVKKVQVQKVLEKVNIPRRKIMTQTKVFAGWKNTESRQCVSGENWLIFKVIMRKQLLLTSLLCARHNAGHPTDIFLTRTTTQ